MANLRSFLPTRRLRLPALALGLALAPVAASAQDAPAEAPAAEAPAAEAPAAAAPAPGPAPGAPATGDSQWIKLCNSDPNTKKELCLVIQELRAETGQFIASATLRQITGEPQIFFVVSTQPGMLIQPGIAVQIDNGKQYNVKFGICFPNACYGEMEVDGTFIGALKNGKQLLIATRNYQGKQVNFPLTLAGFTKTYDGKGLDATAARTRQEELNKALQARAEEARKKLIEQQQKEGGGG